MDFLYLCVLLNYISNNNKLKHQVWNKVENNINNSNTENTKAAFVPENKAPTEDIEGSTEYTKQHLRELLYMEGRKTNNPISPKSPRRRLDLIRQTSY